MNPFLIVRSSFEALKLTITEKIAFGDGTWRNKLDNWIKEYYNFSLIIITIYFNFLNHLQELTNKKQQIQLKLDMFDRVYSQD